MVRVLIYQNFNISTHPGTVTSQVLRTLPSKFLSKRLFQFKCILLAGIQFSDKKYEQSYIN